MRIEIPDTGLRMDDIERSVTENNVARFFGLLTSERDRAQRNVLQQLLLAEETRFAKKAEQLDIADRWLGRCHARIDELKKRLSDGASRGTDMHDTERLMSNFLDIKALLTRHRNIILKDLNGY